MDSTENKNSRIMTFVCKNESKTINFFYFVGILLLFLGIFLFILVRFTNFEYWFLNDTPDCYIERITGIYCPGCGLSRSVIAFLHFNFLKSFVAHPVIIYSFLGYLFLMIKETSYRLFETKMVSESVFLRFVYGGVAITIVQWIIKLIFAIII